MEPVTVLKFASLSKSIAEFLGLIESLNQKIDNLSRAELNAGIRTLKQANSSENEKETLLRDARNYFNKAVSLEKNDRLIISLTGLAMCHSYLGDISNAKSAFLEIEAAKIDINVIDTFLIKQKKITAFSLLIPVNPILLLAKSTIYWRTAFIAGEIARFKKTQTESLSFLKTIMNNSSN